jgi:uncharacterized protein
MEEFVAYIIKNLVSDPASVIVNCTEEEQRLLIEIRVSQEDVGKIIGRRGNTINALRTIVRTVATRLGRKVQIDLIQSENEGESEEVIESAQCTSCEQSESCEQQAFAAAEEEVFEAPEEELAGSAQE